jgi:uncharacterized repeat protein (TIGR04138 family)
MNDLQFAQGMLDRILAREPRYPERAYLFVLAGIEFLQGGLPVRRHVTGAELSWACRDLAIKQFGLLAPSVLGYWNITGTADFGRIVFTLVDVGLLMTQPEDRLEDFVNVFEFADAFSAAQVWDRVVDA